jgi:tRNA(Ile)-lysidine synthase
MPRSHPPTLLSLIARTLDEECGDVQGKRVIVATSGGPDSQALLHALARSAERFRLTLFAHGVDHGLRPEAESELELAADLARSLGVSFSFSRVLVPSGGNLQARARAARYRALEDARKRVGAELCATAHHADDRAETVLLRLLRGTGVRGLGVLPARAGELLRPLIRARKSDVLAHISRHGLKHALDPSNQNRRFLRVRVRLELLPLLEEMSPRVVEHLNALADELNDTPPPLLVDALGAPVVLGRAHLVAIRRLVEQRSRSGRVLLPGGKSVRFDRRLGRPVVEETAPKPQKSRASRVKPSGGPISD